MKLHRKWMRVTVKVFIWLFGILFVIILILYMLVQTSWGNQQISAYARRWLAGKTGARVALAGIDIRGLNGLRIYGLRIADSSDHQILSLDTLIASFNPLAALGKKISIDDLVVSGLSLDLQKPAGSDAYNYAFLIDAFASKDTAAVNEQPSTDTPWDIQLKNLRLSRIDFRMDDEDARDHYAVRLGNLILPLRKTDLNNFQFEAGPATVDSLFADIRMGSQASQPDQDTSTVPLRIVLDQLTVDHAGWYFSDTSSGTRTSGTLPRLLAVKTLYDLRQARFNAGLIEANGLGTMVTYRSGNTTQKTTTPPTGPSFSMAVDSMVFADNAFKVDDAATVPVKGKQFDASHLDIRKLFLTASRITYDSTGYAANIRELRLEDANGFRVNTLRGDVAVTDTSLHVAGLDLATASNKISGDLDLRFTSLSELTTKPAQTRINGSLDAPSIRLDELAYFAPTLRTDPSLQPYLRRNIQASVKADGTLDRLHLGKFSIRTGTTILAGSATLYHPMQPSNLKADLSMDQLAGTRNELKELLPAGTIPDSMWHYVPERFVLRGKLTGSKEQLLPDLVLNSSYGTVTIKGRLDHPTDVNRADYDLVVSARNLDLARVLMDTAYGLVTGQAKMKGHGFDLPTMKAHAELSVDEAYYNQYTYQGVKVQADTDHGSSAATIHANDPNVDMDSDIRLRYDKSVKDLYIDADIRELDLHSLRLSDSIMVLKGRIHADFPNLDSGHVVGNGMIRDLQLQMGRNVLQLDTLTLTGTDSLDVQTLSLRSDLADAELKGHYSIRAIPEAAKTIMDNWLTKEGAPKPFDESILAMLKADVHIPDSNAWVIPGLQKLAPFQLTAVINSDLNQLGMVTNIPYITYQGYTMDSLRIGLLQDNTREERRKANYEVEVSRFSTPNFATNAVSLSGDINKGEVSADLKLMDAKGNMKFNVPVTYFNETERPYLSLKDTLVLNQTRWQVNQGNRIYLDTKKLQGSNLELHYNDQYIRLRADENQASGYPLSLDIHEFSLGTLSAIAIGQSQLISGTINADFRLQSQEPLAMEGQARIDSFTLIGKTVGNLSSSIRQSPESGMDFQVGIDQFGNNTQVKGNYQSSESKLDMTVNMHPLNLSPFGFLLGEFVDSFSGGLVGDLRIQKMKDDLELTGNVGLDTSYMVVKKTGAPLYIPQAALRFDGRKISFDGLTIQDSARNEARLTGSAVAEDLTNFSYDLQFNTSKFLVAGKKRFPDQMVSGPLWTSAALGIKGDMSNMYVNGNLKVLDSSVVSYVYSKDQAGINGEGLIEFFDPNDSTAKDSILIAEARKAPKPGIAMHVNTYITLTPTSTAIIVLDEFTGDQLRAKGDANLNFTMEPGGEMQLMGSYQVESGTYNLTIGGLIKKEFLLQKGSTINWSGDLTKARTDLSALYKVKTDAVELVQEMETVNAAAKQNYDFEVYLMINGELLKPEISFRLDMPTKEQSAMNGTVYTRIRQINNIPSELNKQVMGLLALGTFIAENPFSSLTAGGGGDLSTKAFSTVGSLLSEELNDFLGSVIKDVNIDVGLDIRDDYTSGSAKRRSDLNVGLTKSFAHNRISVYVGNTFALEDENQHTDLLSGLAGDVSIEYLLTPDGRFRLRGYRETDQSLTLNGTVVETGATFVVVVEFNKLKNAFRFKKKDGAAAKPKS